MRGDIAGDEGLGGFGRAELTEHGLAEGIEAKAVPPIMMAPAVTTITTKRPLIERVTVKTPPGCCADFRVFRSGPILCAVSVKMR